MAKPVAPDGQPPNPVVRAVLLRASVASTDVVRLRTGVDLNVRIEPKAFDRAVNDRRRSAYASCPDDVPSSAPVGSPDSASRARRPARPWLGWRRNGNGRPRLSHSPVASSRRSPDAV